MHPELTRKTLWDSLPTECPLQQDRKGALITFLGPHFTNEDPEASELRLGLEPGMAASWAQRSFLP